MAQPNLKEIDLTKVTSKGGEGIDDESTYLALYSGNFITGCFSKSWFGYNFYSGSNSYQFDAPNENYSSWQRLWKIENANIISNEEQMSYAIRKREYAITHKMRSNNQTIDESAPVEAFFYTPMVSAMPKNEDEEYNDDTY